MQVYSEKRIISRSEKSKSVLNSGEEIITGELKITNNVYAERETVIDMEISVIKDKLPALL